MANDEFDELNERGTELTKQQKVIAVCLLLFYLGMIAVTIATAPFNSAIRNDGILPLNLN